MKVRRVSVMFSAVISLVATLSAAAQELPRSTPEEQGMVSSQLLECVNGLDELDGLHSLMILRHGHVVAEGWWAPYRPEYRHSLYSLSKSFTSTAVGIAESEGQLSIDDPVIQYFPEDVPQDASANLKAMRISDLLRMSTGQQTEPPRKPEESWTKTFLHHPVPFKPGTHFVYNTSATYMQSAIVQKATGENLLEYLTPRLFEPLGIREPTWEQSPQGIATGGYGLSIRTEDIARFGQLFLQKGRWNGSQLVPEEWIDAATARQTSNGSQPNSDWDQGYGYQFWRCRYGAYRGDGAFGQYCIVMPEQDMVVAITSGVRNMQAVLDVLWERLLPAVHKDSLPAAPGSNEALRKRLAGLQITRPAGAKTPANGVVGTSWTIARNDGGLEQVSVVESNAEQCVLRLVVNSVEQTVPFGYEEWTTSTLGWGSNPPANVATFAAWQDNTLVTKHCLIETPFIVTTRWKFDDSTVTVQQERNVAFGPIQMPELTGMRK